MSFHAILEMPRETLVALLQLGADAAAASNPRGPVSIIDIGPQSNINWHDISVALGAQPARLLVPNVGLGDEENTETSEEGYVTADDDLEETTERNEEVLVTAANDLEATETNEEALVTTAGDLDSKIVLDEAIRYQYTRLEPGQIRGLRLQGLKLMIDATGVRHRVIIAGLQIITLGNQEFTSDISYSALSYVWNYTTDKDTLAAQAYIYLDGCFIAIAPNLYHALAQLVRDGLTSIIWADAICINQKDDEEKASQIGMMFRIYRTAKEVIAWLGIPNSAEEVEAVRATWDTLQHYAANLNNIPLKRSALEDFEERNLAQSDACQRCMERSRWFNRVWTLQESIAGRNVVLQCGQQRLHLEDYRLVYPRLFKKPGPDEVGELFAIMEKFERHERLDFLELLLRTTSRESSLPKDKVLGLLGLHRGANVVKVDYMTSIADTYIQAVVTTITEGRYLEFLMYAGIACMVDKDTRAWKSRLEIESTNKNPHGLPSWLPDFSNPKRAWAQLKPSTLGPVDPPHWHFIGLTSGRLEVIFGIEPEDIKGEDVFKYAKPTLSYQPMLDVHRMRWLGMAFGRVKIDWQTGEMALSSFPYGAPCCKPRRKRISDSMIPSQSYPYNAVQPLKSSELAKFCLDLKLHDDAKCVCRPHERSNVERTCVSPISPEQSHAVQENDWVCAVVRSRVVVVLRPDCRQDRKSRSLNPWENHDIGTESSTFVLVTSRCWQVDAASRELISNLTRGSLPPKGSLEGISMEFEIR